MYRYFITIHVTARTDFLTCIWGVEVQLYAFLTTALDGGERSASRCGRFTKWKESLYALKRSLDGSRDGAVPVRPRRESNWFPSTKDHTIIKVSIESCLSY
jgi:hypothetical protein